MIVLALSQQNDRIGMKKDECEDEQAQPTIANRLCLTAGTEHIREPNIPVRAYAIAQNGRASGSLADKAAVPSP